MDENKSVLPKVITRLDDGTIIWRYKTVRELMIEELEKNQKKNK